MCKSRTILCFLLVLSLLTTASQSFHVRSAGALPTTQIENELGFDTCGAPSTATMNKWWTSSPYFWIGVYIGGDESACGNAPSSSWFSSQSSTGWDFELIWVGPQAPCTSYLNRFSSNTYTAFGQGKTQAEDALGEVYNLGFSVYTGAFIVYYDMEPFGGTANQSCDAAAKAFVHGWDYELETVDKVYAGYYGNACYSDVNGMASLAPPPSDVAIGQVNGNPDIYGVSCVSKSYWVNHQRIHQYDNNVSHTYGGVSLTVDDDCAWARLQGSNAAGAGSNNCS